MFSWRCSLGITVMASTPSLLLPWLGLQTYIYGMEYSTEYGVLRLSIATKSNQVGRSVY